MGLGPVLPFSWHQPERGCQRPTTADTSRTRTSVPGRIPSRGGFLSPPIQPGYQPFANSAGVAKIMRIWEPPRRRSRQGGQRHAASSSVCRKSARRRIPPTGAVKSPSKRAARSSISSAAAMEAYVRSAVRCTKSSPVEEKIFPSPAAPVSGAMLT